MLVIVHLREACPPCICTSEARVMTSDVILERLIENGLPLQISIPSRSNLLTDELYGYLAEAVNFVQAQSMFDNDVTDECWRTGLAEITASHVTSGRDTLIRYVDRIRSKVEAFLRDVTSKRSLILQSEVRLVDGQEWDYVIKIWNDVDTEA